MNADLNLLDRYHRQGDARAFQSLVQSHAGMVFATAKRVTQNAALAEEIVQDTFLALVRRGDTIRESVAAWLHRVARQKALNALRDHRRHQHREEIAAQMMHEPQEDSWTQIEPVVDEALDDLPMESRVLLIEHFLEQRTQQELAQRLGTSQGTVSRHIDSALQALRDALKRRGVVCGLGLAGLIHAHSIQIISPTLSKSLGKIALSGLKSSTVQAGAVSTFFVAMNTTTKVLLAAGTLAVASIPFLLSRNARLKPTAVSNPPSQTQTVKAKVEARQQAPTHAKTSPKHGKVLPGDQDLILAEFERIGGTLKEEFVEDQIKTIVQEQFGGDHAAFEHTLVQQGMDIEQFRERQRQSIIAAVMKQRVTKDIADPLEKQRAFDAWLLDLQLKSVGLDSQ